GCTGFEVAEALQRSSDVYVELATHATIVLLLGVGQPTGPLKRFAHDLAAELEDIRRPGVAPALAQPQTALRSEAVLSPRVAFLGETRVLAVDEAVGGVSAESIAGYPPGIPALLPGERITAEVVAYLRALSAAGARLHGASDPAFETINVCAQVPVGELAKLVAGALAEDIGTGDVTARATVPESARARAQIAQKQPGVIYGIDAAAEAFRQLDPDAAIETPASEGEWREQGPVLAVEGNARALLAAERTALNLLAHLSGVATLTARCVGAVRGTGATILDTRKTTPGLRALEKAAVRAGGGFNHRAGLHDAVLIKENHVALAGGVGEAVRRALEGAPGLPVEVECRTPAEIGEALAAGAPRILLDNTSLEQLREAVAQVDGRAELEASGGITLESLKAHASTGVQFISIGALTHSAPSLDLSMTLEALR
ncbi:MAG TPA: carboxylating nicotinate-nucleotide diphosphorylase, partial [Solirubrobacteraceae bacterium]